MYKSEHCFRFKSLVYVKSVKLSGTINRDTEMCTVLWCIYGSFFLLRNCGFLVKIIIGGKQFQSKSSFFLLNDLISFYSITMSGTALTFGIVVLYKRFFLYIFSLINLHFVTPDFINNNDSGKKINRCI